MEPVFTILPQPAATAALRLSTDGAAVQDVEYSELRQRLLNGGQVLHHPRVVDEHATGAVLAAAVP